MRRFDVYFLQKRAADGWETLERAQSASVLISSVVREFQDEEDAELRVVGGDWNESIGEWEFSQIFFVDRASIGLKLAEAADDDDLQYQDDGPDASSDTDDVPAAGTIDNGLWSNVSAEEEPPSPAVPGTTAFADVIRAASDEAYEKTDAREDDEELLGDRLTASPSAPRRTDDPREEDTTNEDLRSLGFTRDARGLDEPVGPPPQFRPEPRSRGRAFFMVGTVLISLVLILGAAAALMVAFKVDPAPRYIEMLRHWKNQTMAEAPAGSAAETTPNSAPAKVMPQTAGETSAFRGVAPVLLGRWSVGDCETEYLEFESDGFVMATSGRAPSSEIPVIETLEDEYTWYIRRSETLVQHFQKLGENDIQLIGETTPVGFTQRTSEVFSRCHG